ncbi:MAG: energy-coupling factor transporter ATPase [Chloroflexia bacterium]
MAFLRPPEAPRRDFVSASGRLATEPLICVQGLHFRYMSPTGQSVPALRGIDLEIAAGEYVALIGPNGSGKSTLARLLNGLLLPTAGRVLVKGMDTAEPVFRQKIRQTVGMVFQNPESQFVATVVEEDVAFGPENLGLPDEEMRARVEWALRVTGLWELRHRSPLHLSGGQKQRLALAGALAMRPEVLILDEATSMLDPASRQAVRRVVGDLHAAGLTVISITQAMDEAAEAQRVIVLYEGRIAMDGPPSEVFANAERLQSLGLDVPPITQLARMLHERIPSFPPVVLTPRQMVAVVRARARRGTDDPAH